MTRKGVKYPMENRETTALDHKRATRKFYAEITRKSTAKEQFGPVVNEKGSLSTSLEECLENWRSYYKNLYRKAEEKEIMENDCDEIEDELKTSKEMQEDTIDKDITFEELVEAVYALKTNTAAGSDSILSNDIVELLRISNENESWKTVEVL